MRFSGEHKARQAALGQPALAAAIRQSVVSQHTRPACGSLHLAAMRCTQTVLRRTIVARSCLAMRLLRSSGPARRLVRWPNRRALRAVTVLLFSDGMGFALRRQRINDDPARTQQEVPS